MVEFDKRRKPVRATANIGVVLATFVLWPIVAFSQPIAQRTGYCANNTNAMVIFQTKPQTTLKGVWYALLTTFPSSDQPYPGYQIDIVYSHALTQDSYTLVGIDAQPAFDDMNQQPVGTDLFDTCPNVYGPPDVNQSTPSNNPATPPLQTVYGYCANNKSASIQVSNNGNPFAYQNVLWTYLTWNANGTYSISVHTSDSSDGDAKIVNPPASIAFKNLSRQKSGADLSTVCR
jgi:hypothetical protein